MRKTAHKGRVYFEREVFFCLLLLVIFVLQSLPGYAKTENQYTVYVKMDESLDFSKLTAIEFSVEGANIDDIDISVVNTTQSVIIGGVPVNGAVPASSNQKDYWKFYEVTRSNGVAGYRDFDNAAQLTPGLLLTLEGGKTFSLCNPLLGSSYYKDGYYPFPYQIVSKEVLAGSLYTLQNHPVPLPSSILFLFIGMMGLFPIRFALQKNKSSALNISSKRDKGGQRPRFLRPQRATLS